MLIPYSLLFSRSFRAAGRSGLHIAFIQYSMLYTLYVVILPRGRQKEWAARALCNLVAVPENVTAIARGGGIPRLVSLTASGAHSVYSIGIQTLLV